MKTFIFIKLLLTSHRKASVNVFPSSFFGLCPWCCSDVDLFSFLLLVWWTPGLSESDSQRWCHGNWWSSGRKPTHRTATLASSVTPICLWSSTLSLAACPLPVCRPRVCLRRDGFRGLGHAAVGGRQQEERSRRGGADRPTARTLIDEDEGWLGGISAVEVRQEAEWCWSRVGPVLTQPLTYGLRVFVSVSARPQSPKAGIENGVTAALWEEVFFLKKSIMVLRIPTIP